MYAIKKKLLNHVTLLLEYNADVNKSNDQGKTPLIEAIEIAPSETSLQFTELLLSYGADVNQADEEDYTPLMAAARFNETKIIHLLLKHNASLEALDDYEETALYYAILCENPISTHTIKVLKEYGANLEHQAVGGFTPLMTAIQAGYLEKIELLLSFNIDVNQTNEQGRTALFIAI